MQSIKDIISDYVNDHYKHFGAYPAEVEVNGIIYIWDEYWEILEEQGE